MQFYGNFFIGEMNYLASRVITQRHEHVKHQHMLLLTPARWNILSAVVCRSHFSVQVGVERKFAAQEV